MLREAEEKMGQDCFRIDLKKYFFTSDSEIQDQLTEVYRLCEELVKYRGRMSDSHEILLEILQLSDRIDLVCNRLGSFLQLSTALDMTDQTWGPRIHQALGEATGALSWLEGEIRSIPDERFTQFLGANAELAKFDYFMISIRGERDLVSVAGNSGDGARTGAQLASMIAQTAASLVRLRDLAESKCIARPVMDSEGKSFDPRYDWMALSMHPERAVRAEAFNAFHEAYEKNQDFFAHSYVEMARLKNFKARVMGYESTWARALAGMQLDPQQTLNLLDSLVANVGLNKRLENFKADLIRKFQGIEDVSLYDLNTFDSFILSRSENRNQFPLQWCREQLVQAFEPLGQEYQNLAQELFDPEKGLIQAGPTGRVADDSDEKESSSQRQMNAFCNGYFKGPWFIYLSSALLSPRNLMTLAHEMGHALHFRFRDMALDYRLQAREPDFFTEGLAMFNEILLATSISRNQQLDPGLRLLFKYHQVQRLFGIFGLGVNCLTEYRLHDAIISRGGLGPEEITAITCQTAEDYTIYNNRTFGLKWAVDRTLTSIPFYSLRYFIGSLISLRLYLLCEKRGEDFADGFIRLLQRANRAMPGQVFLETMGQDLTALNLDDIIPVLEEHLEELMAIATEWEAR